MARSLTEELASLKIDRRETPAYRPEPSRRPRSRSGFGTRLVSLAIWLVPLGLLGGAGYYGYTQYSKLKGRPEVTVGLVQTMTVGEAEKLLSAKGYIMSRHQADIGAKAPGRVEAMLVEEGAKVSEGQLLAILEHNDTKAVLESKKAMIERSEADLKEAESDYQVKERKAKRWQSMLSRGTATVEETDGYISARDMSASRVRSLKATINLQRALMKETEETINNMRIVAPFAGTVLTKEAEVGETITPGGMGAASGRGSVVTLADLSKLEVETDIAENLLSRVAIGQPAEVSVSAVPGKHYRGRLRKIIPMGDRTRGTVKVHVEIVDPDEHLFPELVATVHFLPDKSLNNPNAGKSFLFVPKAGVFQENGHAFSWVIDRLGVVRKRPIEIVESSDDLARVEKGLVAGDSVVLKPSVGLRDGEKVTVAE